MVIFCKMQAYFIFVGTRKIKPFLYLFSVLPAVDPQQMNLLPRGWTLQGCTWRVITNRSPSSRWETHTVCIWGLPHNRDSSKMQMESSKRSQAHCVRKHKTTRAQIGLILNLTLQQPASKWLKRQMHTYLGLACWVRITMPFGLTLFLSALGPYACHLICLLSQFLFMLNT